MSKFKSGWLLLFLQLLFVSALESFCPGSAASWMHAACQTKIEFKEACSAVRGEITKRIEGQPHEWIDPHNAGTYSFISQSDSLFELSRLTGDKMYTDKITFAFEEKGVASCSVAACSESQVFSVLDFGTNYCNLKNLYCSEGECHPFRALKYTETVGTCSDQSPSKCQSAAKPTVETKSMPRLDLSALSDVSRGLVVASMPTISMVASSALMSSVQVSKVLESILQFFCGGMIIAAVAAELFPLMVKNVSSVDSIIGVTAGFVVGLVLVYGVAWVMEKIEGEENGGEADTTENAASKSQQNKYGSLSSIEMVSPGGTIARQSRANHGEGEGEGEGVGEGEERAITSSLPDDDIETARELQLYQPSRVGTPEPQAGGWAWNEEDVRLAELAFSNPMHRSHVTEHLQEIVAKVVEINAKSVDLLDRGEDMTADEQEQLAEDIDKAVHELQYLLDHSRRLVEGAESAILGTRVKIWLTEDRKRTMRRRITALLYAAEHLQQHVVSERSLDAFALKEVHAHMADMDKQISLFHDSVQKVASRWGRKAYTLPDPELGDVIPAGLVVPVTLDCFVDGFLIGVTVALSPKAGVILGAANVLEMGSLGMAYAVRLKNCTGSRVLSRALALYSPPFVMLLSAGFGAKLAASSQAIPSMFVGFVAFGTVALLALACNELIVEARSALEGEGPKWPSIFLFIGVWVVLMTDRLCDAFSANP